MTRRERTTALPRHTPRVRPASGWQVGPLKIDPKLGRWAILGAIVVLLLGVIGAIAYRIYDDRYGRPGTVILSVGSSDVTLGYYTDRLVQFAQANADSGVALAEQALLNKLEDEELTIQLAADKGLTISEQDITDAIAKELGVPVAGPGSPFDLQYRARLKTVKMSDSNYRRLKKAEVANSRLLDFYSNENGGIAEQVTLRTIVVADKAQADDLLKRVQGGEDLGSLAQVESAELESRSADGLMKPEPPALLPASIQAAIEGKSDGALLGPVQVEDNYWVFRLEKRDPQGLLTEAQKSQLGQKKFDDALKAKRAATKITRSLDADDIKWAEKNAN